MANSVKASCGHYVWAFGAEGSIARKRCESQPCNDCKALAKAATYDANVAALPVLDLEPATDADRVKYIPLGWDSV